MDVHQLLTDSQPAVGLNPRRPQPSIEDGNHTSYQPWQNNGTRHTQTHGIIGLDQSPQRPIAAGAALGAAPPKAHPKIVTFEYLLPEAPLQRARLPMRVNIYPHDETHSIVTTVKNFYGLYDGNGVSFEDKQGNTLIARYENFHDRMVVLVRVVDDVVSQAGTPQQASLSPKRPHLGPAFEASSSFQSVGMDHGISRPSSRSTRHRSGSPLNRGRQSVSVGANSKSRSRPNIKSRTGSTHGSFADGAALGADMSDSDDCDASVTSSRRGKAELVASADISVENIVEGGRRKRARFDSSELPLFVPSQVPMSNSISSVSPQRRIGQPNMASPYQPPNQFTFSYNYPLPSPQSRGYSDIQMNNGQGYSTPGGPGYGGKRPGSYAPSRYGSGSGILPTPDPTIGSVISDEDVALQLMRLGEASNFSSHGRTSTSTVDDALSGKAEASDYSDEGSDMDEDVPQGAQGGYASDESSAEDYSGHEQSNGAHNHDTASHDHGHPQKPLKTKTDGDKRDGIAQLQSKIPKLSKPKSKKTEHGSNGAKTPTSPTSLSAQSRKASNASLPTYGPDEEDLSAKPRCQRCRKSKKGCDRQRPCGRCRDAGIGAEGCLSEDEGNGRKGRYGRHMGVAIKKDGMPSMLIVQDIQPMAAPPMIPHTPMGPPSLMGMKDKKRKR